MDKGSDQHSELQNVNEYFGNRVVEGAWEAEASRTWESDIAQHFNNALTKRFDEEKRRADEARKNAKRRGSASDEMPEEPVEELKPLLPLMEWISKAVQEALYSAETKFASRGMKTMVEKATTG